MRTALPGRCRDFHINQPKAARPARNDEVG
jgi:hypothetical protein